jgi:hypothetical protein
VLHTAVVFLKPPKGREQALIRGSCLAQTSSHHLAVSAPLDRLTPKFLFSSCSEIVKSAFPSRSTDLQDIHASSIAKILRDAALPAFRSGRAAGPLLTKDMSTSHDTSDVRGCTTGLARGLISARIVTSLALASAPKAAPCADRGLLSSSNRADRFQVFRCCVLHGERFAVQPYS